jgi:bifunctional DNA-binding transcriptional regulator/antitoxin component of YhaV-PrlF toxin-antitoxin module
MKVLRKETKVHTTNYTSIPADYRETFNIQPGDTLVWEHSYGDPYFKVYIKKNDSTKTQE